MTKVTDLGERIFLPVLLLVGIFLGVVLGLSFWSPAGEGAAPSAGTASYIPITPAPAPVVGAPAPDIHLRDLAGRAVQLSEFRGAPVILVFWATWCDPCRAELPELNSRASVTKVLAINYGEDRETAAAYATSLELNTLTLLLDPDFIARDTYRIGGLPATFVVDAAGTIRFMKIGSLQPSELDAALSAPGGNS
jgi:peroxiredoxin